VRIVRSWEERAVERLPAPACAYDAPARAADLVDDTPEGVRGLAGNLWEWTADADGDGRVQKGGSWLAEDVWAWRGASRTVLPPSARLPDVGFRCAF
jgi:formylglycine-generating enzyme required for sulfatase activity